MTAYEGGSGVRPLILFTDHRGEGYVESAQELPAGWKIEQDTNYEDNSDLQPTQLVGCVDRVRRFLPAPPANSRTMVSRSSWSWSTPTTS